MERRGELAAWAPAVEKTVVLCRAFLALGMPGCFGTLTQGLQDDAL